GGRRASRGGPVVGLHLWRDVRRLISRGLARARRRTGRSRRVAAADEPKKAGLGVGSHDRIVLFMTWQDRERAVRAPLTSRVLAVALFAALSAIVVLAAATPASAQPPDQAAAAPPTVGTIHGLITTQTTIPLGGVTVSLFDGASTVAQLASEG